MATLHFQRPAALAALAALPLLALLWWRACRIARRASPGAANGPRGALRIAALGVLVVAVAGPVGLEGARAGPERAPVLFVLDVSASMGTPDVDPDRLGAARRAIEHVAELLPQSRVALVAAATDAVVVCPLTRDRGAFLSLVARARTRWMGRAGSRLAPALEEAHEVLQREGGAGAVVLVSDGEGHEDPPLDAARRIRSAGGVLHTVVVGSTDGAPIVTPSGQTVTTAARPDAMAELARAGGGRAWLVGPDRTALPQEAGQVASVRLGQAAAVRSGEGARLAPWLYALAALLLGVSALMRR